MGSEKLISADSHVNEPGDLWVERVDKEFRDRAPRVVDDIPGRAPGSYLTACARRRSSPRGWCRRRP
jgi:hypothetical protein